MKRCLYVRVAVIQGQQEKNKFDKSTKYEGETHLRLKFNKANKCIFYGNELSSVNNKWNQAITMETMTVTKIFTSIFSMYFQV